MKNAKSIFLVLALIFFGLAWATAQSLNDKYHNFAPGEEAKFDGKGVCSPIVVYNGRSILWKVAGRTINLQSNTIAKNEKKRDKNIPNKFTNFWVLDTTMMTAYLSGGGMRMLEVRRTPVPDSAGVYSIDTVNRVFNPKIDAGKVNQVSAYENNKILIGFGPYVTNVDVENALERVKCYLVPELAYAKTTNDELKKSEMALLYNRMQLEYPYDDSTKAKIRKEVSRLEGYVGKLKGWHSGYMATATTKLKEPVIAEEIEVYRSALIREQCEGACLLQSLYYDEKENIHPGNGVDSGDPLVTRPINGESQEQFLSRMIENLNEGDEFVYNGEVWRVKKKKCKQVGISGQGMYTGFNAGIAYGGYAGTAAYGYNTGVYGANMGMTGGNGLWVGSTWYPRLTSSNVNASYNYNANNNGGGSANPGPAGYWDALYSQKGQFNYGMSTVK